MTVAECRADIASTVTAELSEFDIQVSPYRESLTPPLTGWVEILSVDTSGCSTCQLRVTGECLILVASDRAELQQAQDLLTAPLIAAVELADGEDVIVQPADYPIDSVITYCLVARFTTWTSRS